tara:strand:+ start:8352 stop:9956 length:1605 start_codon:yes stop_codon:yes gene_type:complete
MIFETVAELKLATLTAGQLVSTKGYTASGDGDAADYIVRTSQAVDGVKDHALANGNVALLQEATAAYVSYQAASGPISDVQTALRELSLHVKDYGAVGDGVTDDTAALLAACASGEVLYFGGAADNYRITAALAITLTADLHWTSDGATITVDSAASIQRAVDITGAGFDVNIQGKLTIDCDRKAFSGAYIYNNTSFADLNISQLYVRDCHRATTAFTGGDGIWVRGAWDKVALIDIDIRNVTMATGAGVLSSQGITGITVSSAGIGLAPQQVDITRVHIDGVYSEDPTYQYDQDGLRIFTEEDIVGEPRLFEGSFLISGGDINNCGGRSIKSQMEHGVIDGVKFSRNSTEVPEIVGNRLMPDIDFQVGGGIVSNCEFRYSSSTPDEVINMSGSRQLAKYSHGTKVVNVNVSISGSGNLDRFCSVGPREQDRFSVDISNVDITGSDTLVYFVGISGSNVNPDVECYVNIENIRCAISNSASSAFVWRTSSADVAVYASGRNLVKTVGAATANFSGATNAGDFTSVLEGNNVRVA